jgi:hypothetical protein
MLCPGFETQTTQDTNRDLTTTFAVANALICRRVRVVEDKRLLASTRPSVRTGRISTKFRIEIESLLKSGKISGTVLEDLSALFYGDNKMSLFE